MSSQDRFDSESRRRDASGLLDVLIRAGLILALVMLCYRVFSPFLTLMVWALILAVTLYPLHQSLAGKMGGKQGLAATLLVLLGFVLIVVPTAVLMNSLGDSVHQLINDVQKNALEIPAPRDGVAKWPLVGEKMLCVWSKAYADLPALVQSLQPKIGDLAKTALGFVAGIGGGLLQFLAAFIIAGIIMAFGESGSRGSRAIFERIVGAARAANSPKLSTATIRAVAQGVIGVAFIQAIIVGLCLLVAGVPWAGVLAVIVLVLGDRPGAGADRHPAGHRLHLVERRLRHCRGDRLHRAAVRAGHGGQRAQAADARPRGRCADAGHPARRARWHGGRGNPRHVRRGAHWRVVRSPAGSTAFRPPGTPRGRTASSGGPSR